MIRTVSAMLALLLLAAAPLRAQVPAPRTDDLGTRLIGTWEGPYQSDQAPPGALQLVIGMEAGAWKVTLQVQSDQPIDAAEVRDFKLEGDQISWVQDIMGMECRSLATLENGTLKGGSECSQGGAVAVTATFVMLKQ